VNSSANTPKVRSAIIYSALALLGAAVAVFVARWFVSSEIGNAFLAQYPGTIKANPTTPTGIPVWLNVQHFLNAFFIVLIVRTGWMVRTVQRPEAYWTNKPTRLFGRKSEPRKISLHLWLHMALDLLWVINGAVYLVLLFISGHWQRLVPTSWDILPNAASAAVQYASLNWPQENGWVSYNSLQQLAYFAIVFIAAPLAAISGLRMSHLWNSRPDSKLSRVFPLAAARAVHFPTMIFFVLFVVAHVSLVMLTGARQNLNHIFASSPGDGWLGVVLLVGLIAVTAAAWFFSKPVFVQPIASLFGKVTRQ
jgi:thiosulfate reductase cytochrome b subunit